METVGYNWKQERAAEKAFERRENNLQFIENDATIKANSGFPKKLTKLPSENLQHTVNVDILPQRQGDFEFHAIAPKGAEMSNIEVMAGAGTSTPIRDLKRLYATYGKDADGWQKKSGTAYGKSYHYVVHWYEHNGYIPEDEIKLKGMGKNK